MAAFSGLFLLKMANLFPTELDLAAIMVQVEEAAQLLSEVAAERYALTLRLMLANLRRKIGLPPALPSAQSQVNTTPGGTPLNLLSNFSSDASVPFTSEELGFSWSGAAAQNQLTPSTIPAWLQEGSFNDLGLPVNGLDGIFFPGPSTGWPTEVEMVPEAW